MVVVTGTDPDGDAIARPATWDNTDGPPPVIFMVAEPRGRPALAPGERVLARLAPGVTVRGRVHDRKRRLRRPVSLCFHEGAAYACTRGCDRRPRWRW